MFKTIVSVLTVTLLFWLWSINKVQAQVFDPVKAHKNLLEESSGYFKFANGTGGEGGEVVYVTNLFDQGPGSMRSFLEMENTPQIILFENGLNGLIDLQSTIDVESDKTLWGRHRDGTGADVLVSANSSSSAAFKISGDTVNIIISNLKGNYFGPNDSAPDWVIVRGQVGNQPKAWIDHISIDGGCGPIGRCPDEDGFVDVKTSGVTISWNRVENADNVHLITDLDEGDLLEVTLHHNLYRNNNSRTPRISAPGSVHFYNNWVDAWRSSGAEGANGGEMRLENNIFSSGPDEDDDAILGRWAGTGNVLEGIAVAVPQSTGVFVPSYSYTLDPTLGLKERLEKEAGWQAFAIPEPKTVILGMLAYFLSACLLGRFFYVGRK